MSITGSGSLNIISALVNAGNSVTSVKLSDSAANVVANLDLLETLAAQGKLTSITLTDTGTPVLTITVTQEFADALALKAIVSPYSVAVIGIPASAPTGPLLDNLSLNQQLELIYIAYYNRAADEGGFSFWGGQNATAQANGQSASLALTNIANSFAPQAETDALYPILGTPDLNLQTAAAQAGLTTFIGNVYSNLFDRTADTAGQAYWVGQITSGAVGLGAAALAIANGATGSDAIEVQNKIAVALDFTTRTAASGLGVTPPYPSSFLPAARSVLAGVDGTSLNDASVTAGEAATTTFISSAPTAIVATGGALSASSANDQITISTSNSVTDPGAGSFTIQFATGVSGDTLVLHSGGPDQIIGFNPAAGDVLDLSSLLAGARLTAQEVLPNLGSYFTISDQGADAVLQFDPLGHGNGSAVAVLKNLGGDVTSLGVLSAHNALQL